MENRKILEYYLAEARQVAAWRQLELVFLELDERPIAFCYGWNAKGVRFCVKIGFDEAVAKYGPGQQLIFRLLEHAHDDPESLIYDFHGRLVPWTESWITRSYPVGRVLIVSKGAASRSLFQTYARLHPLLKAARAKLQSG
jgi:CelD/BcsL family acetyltransferase involved in cellulose biosynthesis